MRTMCEKLIVIYRLNISKLVKCLMIRQLEYMIMLKYFYTNKLYIIVIAMLINSIILNGQNISINTGEKTNKRRVFIGVVPNFSYTGINTSTILGYEKNKVRIQGGIKVVLSETYFPRKGVIGGELGIVYTFFSGKKLESFGLINYQASFYKPLSRKRPTSNKKNGIHEFSFSYGLRINLNKNIWLENSIGYGIYMIRSHDLIEGTTNTSYGNSGLIRIGLFFRLY